MSEIIIGKPYTTIEDDNTISLNSDILINNKKEKLFIKLDKKYKSYLVTENIDAFVIAILPVALKNGYTIKSEASISKRLLYQLHQNLIPCLLSNKKDTKKVNFELKTTEEEIESKNKVVTIYTGKYEIDNLFTFYENQIQKIDYFKLTHLIKINGLEPENKILKQDEINEICTDQNIEIINIETNILNITNENFYSIYDYHNIAIIYAMRKLFNTLIISSTYTIQEFTFTEDTASHELLIADSLRLPNLMICLSGGAYKRERKIEILRNNNKFQKFIK